jgi:acetylornithine deacetylase/succinyl-diaminopimelate desuccinylase family protein
MVKPELEELFKHISREEIIKTSQQLINIPSVTGEEKVIIYLAKKMLENRGIPTRLFGSEERPALTATINPDGKKQLIFNGHLDTVPTASLDAWTHNPFDPVVSDNTLYGRGSCDMKASCAVMIHVIGILNGFNLPLSIGVHLVPDEEKGATYGTRLLIGEIEKGNLRKPDYVIIGEKSNLKLRIAERGGFSFKIKFKGKATHTAYARTEGINAIAKASKGILALEKPIDKWHPWIGSPVLSINSIQGGTVGNQVPDECIISIDRRIIPGENPETVVSEVKSLLDEAGKNDPDWNWEIITNKDSKGNTVYSPANYTEPESPFGDALKKAAKKALNTEPELFVEWAGGTDGAHYRKIGIQTIGFGPKGEHMHGPNELVYIDSLIDQAKTYLALALELSGNNF